MKKILYSVMALAIAAMTFTACEDVPEPYPTPVPGQKPVVTYEGEGTLEKPYTVADAINYAKSFGQANSDKAVYIKGYITAITEEYSTNFGNATFEISDTKEGGNKFIFWRGLYLGNKKYSSGKTQIKVGDEVIICGKVVNYKGNTPETVQGEAFLYSLNGVDEGGGGSDTPAEAKGSGTLEDPFNPAGAVAYAKTVGDKESDKDVYIKGKVSSISDQYSTQFGNATFNISEDGTPSNEFTVYRALYLGNKKYTSGDLLKEGDEVIVCGKVTNYKGNTPETVQGKAYLYSLNGKSEGGGGDTPQGEAKGDGSLSNPFNAVAAVNYAKTVGDKESDKDVYIKGKVSSITDQFGTQFGNATFNISDDGKAGNEFTVYRALYLGNQKYTAGDLLKEGDEVIVCGKVTNYKGNTPETVQGKAYLYSLNGKTESSGGTPTPQPGGEVKTVTVADFNAAAESNDVWYQLTGTVKNLKDGDQYGNFDLEDATGSVYVYGLLSEKGGEKKKFQDLVAAKGIKNGCTLTIIGTRGSYNDKIEVTNAYFVSIEGGDTPGGGGGGDTPGGGGGTTVTSLTNGDFEAWSGNQPTGWKSASTASSATLAQSTDAHGGSYSVNVNGKESSNVRLASQEITLTAGTYLFSFYAKATTADASQVRPGYVPVADGKVGSYAYGNYANLSNTSWTQVTHEFTLDAETTVCLVVMNPKKSGYSSGKDVLVDDATLTKK